MRSVAGVRLSPGSSAYQKIISNNSYAHDEQGVNPGQIRGFDGEADIYDCLLANAAEVSIRWPGDKWQTGGAGTE